MKIPRRIAPWAGVVTSMLLPLIALAAYNNVTVLTEGITINLPTTNKNYTLTRVTNVESFAVNGTNIDFVMLNGSIVGLESPDRHSFTVGAGCTTLAESCDATKSIVTVSCTTGATIRITPDTANICGGSASTISSGTGGGGSVGSGITAPTTPVEPGVIAKTTVTMSVNTPVVVNLGSSSHTATVTAVSAASVTVTIQSNPVTITLALNETKDIDTNGDGKNDLRVIYKGLSGDRPQLEFKQIDIAAAPAQPVKTVAPTTPPAALSACALATDMAYKRSGSSAVYYVTAECTKRPFVNSRVFFTYFDKWSDVTMTTKVKLDGISDDKLGFLPWGPKFDPQYGALAKVTSDPKVYLLLGNDKYWINSEAVFNALGYKWNWIEDIDGRLLNKYQTGSEISYTNRHPNYTLVKYVGDAKVYRLEPDPADAGKQVKRHIKDEKAFKALKYRLDRIVILPSSENYADGAVLTNS